MFDPEAADTTGYYNFNIDYDDSTPNNNDAVDETSTLDTGTKKLGVASVEFDGVNDFINASSDSSLDFGTENFSISAWFNSSGTGENFIAGRTDGSNNGWYLKN